MPTPYTLELRWRVVWLNLVHGFSSHEVSELLCLSERTVRRYLTLFHQTGDVKPVSRRNGAQRLLGDLEQLHLLQIVLYTQSRNLSPRNSITAARSLWCQNSRIDHMSNTQVHGVNKVGYSPCCSTTIRSSQS